MRNISVRYSPKIQTKKKWNNSCFQLQILALADEFSRLLDKKKSHANDDNEFY